MAAQHRRRGALSPNRPVRAERGGLTPKSISRPDATPGWRGGAPAS